MTEKGRLKKHANGNDLTKQMTHKFNIFSVIEIIFFGGLSTNTHKLAHIAHSINVVKQRIVRA